MPIVFDGPPGRVVAMADPAIQGVMPALVTVQPDISFQARKSLITHLVVSQTCNYQFLHTLGGDIYVYVFGDRIGEMTIGGLAIGHDCDRPGDREHGFEKMMAWFKDNKMSKRSDPVTVMIGQTPLLGFVTNLNGAVFDHKLYLLQFNLTLALVPEK